MSVGIKKIEGVESVNVSLNQGRATIQLKPDNTVRLEQVREAVERNGFTPKEARVTARGEVVPVGGKLQFKLSGVNQTYDLQVDPQTGITLEQLRKEAGKTLLVEGVIAAARPPKERAPQVLQVKSFKPAQ